MNLYLHDVNGKLIRRLTDVDADVEFVAAVLPGNMCIIFHLKSPRWKKQLFRVEVKSGKEKPLDNRRGVAQYYDEW